MNTTDYFLRAENIREDLLNTGLLVPKHVRPENTSGSYLLNLKTANPDL